MGKAVTIDQRWLRFAGWAFLCLLIVGVAAGVGAVLIIKPPEADKKRSEEDKRPEVEVQEVEVITAQIDLSSQGEIRPQRRTALSAEVAGKLVVVDEAFEAGETFEEGALLLRIDRADYEAAYAAAEATLAEAKLALEMETVRKAQALRDWAKLGLKGEPSALVRRVPHLLSAEAKVASAEAAVQKALRDRERTEIRAPYSCRIERTYVDLGAVVSPGMPLVDLVSLGPVEVRLPLSLEDYGYLQRGEDGRVSGAVRARGRIGGVEREWSGVLVRSEEIVESTTRSINVVAQFGRDGAEAPPIGMFVKAVIAGISLPNVVEVPRMAVRNGSEVLLVNQDEALEFREVAVVRTEATTILVSGNPSEGERTLKEGERILVTPLSAPVSGLKVEVLPAKTPEETPQGSEAAALAP